VDNVNLVMQEMAVEPQAPVMEAQMHLGELQLALIGGGCGETVFD
jgi:hypothetical protein